MPKACKCDQMHFPILHHAIRFRMACTEAVGRCCIADPTIYLCASLVHRVSRRSAASRLMCIHAAVADPDEGAAWSTLVAETQFSVLQAPSIRMGYFTLISIRAPMWIPTYPMVSPFGDTKGGNPYDFLYQTFDYTICIINCSYNFLDA